MADVHTLQQRSYNMQQIRSGNTKPELLVRKFLHAQGFRYKLHDKTLPGKPDIVLPKYKTIIFIHACPTTGGDVSGTDMPTVNILKYRKQEHSGGRIKLTPTRLMMQKL
jgi:DNA mismatch endonuclease Vsr